MYSSNCATGGNRASLPWSISVRAEPQGNRRAVVNGLPGAEEPSQQVFELTGCGSGSAARECQLCHEWGAPEAPFPILLRPNPLSKLERKCTRTLCKGQSIELGADVCVVMRGSFFPQRALLGRLPRPVWEKLPSAALAPQGAASQPGLACLLTGLSEPSTSLDAGGNWGSSGLTFHPS